MDMGVGGFEACLEVSAPAVEINCPSLLKIPISVSFGQQFPMRQFTSGSKCRFFSPNIGEIV